MDAQQVASLIERIEQMCRDQETVLGTDIGNEIKLRFPEVSLKVDFGGLRKFIQDHVPEVVWVRAQGGDGIYALRSRAITASDEVPAARSSSNESASAPQTGTAWAAFVDPNVQSHLAVDPTSGTLHPFAQADVPELPLIRLDKLSIEEHRTIATSFVPMIPPAARGSFESALAAEVFWWKWTAAFKSLADKGIYARWMKWRFDNIMRIFGERLKSAGLGDAIIAAASIELQRAKQSKSSSVRPLLLPETRSGIAQTVGFQDLRLQDLAKSAIGFMSDEDLRRMWIPLGAVADALRRKV